MTLRDLIERLEGIATKHGDDTGVWIDTGEPWGDLVTTYAYPGVEVGVSVDGFKNGDFDQLFYRDGASDDVAEAIEDDLDADGDLGRDAQDFTIKPVVLLSPDI